LIFATNPSPMPSSTASNAVPAGNAGKSVEIVLPAMKALPLPSTAMLRARSSSAPPRYVE